MKVGVDGRSLVGGGARGVAHYTGALLTALAAAHPEAEWRLLLPRAAAAAVPPGVHATSARLPGRLLHGSAAAVRRPRADRILGGVDVFWAPAPAPLALSRDVPLVLTVHDRSWEQRPRDFTPYERGWHAAARPRALARRATRVLCDAETVRSDIVAAWRLAPERVRAVALAPAAGLAPSRGRTPTAPPYLLFVGALEPRKGPDILLAAHARARARGLAADLWLVGDGRLSPSLTGPGVRRLGRVDDAALADLYAGALALVVPSRIEGFGLPLVEALAHGTPVIASDLPVLREVVGEDGALFVAPGDEGALAAALMRVATDAGERARLVTAGRDATAGLSWAATAQATWAVLSEAAGAG